MGRVGGDEDDFELASVEVVPDHDLVAVPRERMACLRDEQVLVRLELGNGSHQTMED